MDLTEFITARLDEDEAAAKAAKSEWWKHVVEFASANHYEIFGDASVEYCEWFPNEADAEHIARHDPARVLREVAAKRAMLADLTSGPFPYRDDCDDKLRLFMRLLGSAWSDHPDYQPEWAL